VFRLNLRRARKLIRLYDESRRRGKSHNSLADLLRMCLVFTMGSLDAFIHQVVGDNIVPYLKRNVRASRYDPARRARVSEIEALIKGIFTAIDYLQMLDRARPFVTIRSSVDRELSLRTYQSPDQIDKAFRLFAVSDFWKSLEGSGMGGPLAEKAASKLKKYFDRRNRIAHEMDREKSRRMRNRKRPIARSDCYDCLAVVNLVVHFIETTYLDPSRGDYLLR